MLNFHPDFLEDNEQQLYDAYVYNEFELKHLIKSGRVLDNCYLFLL